MSEAASSSPDSNDELPILTASQRSGVPRRTIYRWIESHRLKSRTLEGEQLVSLAAVRAVAAGRGPGSRTAIAGVDVGNGTANGTRSPTVAPANPAASDGALAAEVFRAFEEGKQPAEVVREFELNPQAVLALWRQFDELRNVGHAKGPTLAEQIAALDLRLQVLESTINGQVISGVGALRATVEQIVAFLHELPLPPKSKFTCTCGQTGQYLVPVKCYSCGRQTWWGFQSEER